MQRLLPSVRVVFCIEKPSFESTKGHVAIMGSSPCLGNWDSDNALPAKYMGCNSWIIETCFPPNSDIQFQLIVLETPSYMASLNTSFEEGDSSKPSSLCTEQDLLHYLRVAGTNLRVQIKFGQQQIQVLESKSSLTADGRPVSINTGLRTLYVPKQLSWEYLENDDNIDDVEFFRLAAALANGQEYTTIRRSLEPEKHKSEEMQEFSKMWRQWLKAQYGVGGATKFVHEADMNVNPESQKPVPKAKTIPKQSTKPLPKATLAQSPKPIPKSKATFTQSPKPIPKASVTREQSPDPIPKAKAALTQSPKPIPKDIATREQSSKPIPKSKATLTQSPKPMPKAKTTLTQSPKPIPKERATITQSPKTIPKEIATGKQSPRERQATSVVGQSLSLTTRSSKTTTSYNTKATKSSRDSKDKPRPKPLTADRHYAFGSTIPRFAGNGNTHRALKTTKSNPKHKTTELPPVSKSEQIIDSCELSLSASSSIDEIVDQIHDSYSNVELEVDSCDELALPATGERFDPTEEGLSDITLLSDVELKIDSYDELVLPATGEMPDPTEEGLSDITLLSDVELNIDSCDELVLPETVETSDPMEEDSLETTLPKHAELKIDSGDKLVLPATGEIPDAMEEDSSNTTPPPKAKIQTGGTEITIPKHDAEIAEDKEGDVACAEQPVLCTTHDRDLEKKLQFQKRQAVFEEHNTKRHENAIRQIETGKISVVTTIKERIAMLQHKHDTAEGAIHEAAKKPEDLSEANECEPDLIEDSIKPGVIEKLTNDYKTDDSMCDALQMNKTSAATKYPSKTKSGLSEYETRHVPNSKASNQRKLQGGKICDIQTHGNYSQTNVTRLENSTKANSQSSPCINKQGHDEDNSPDYFETEPTILQNNPKSNQETLEEPLTNIVASPDVATNCNQNRSDLPKDKGTTITPQLFSKDKDAANVLQKLFKAYDIAESKSKLDISSEKSEEAIEEDSRTENNSKSHNTDVTKLIDGDIESEGGVCFERSMLNIFMEDLEVYSHAYNENANADRCGTHENTDGNEAQEDSDMYTTLDMSSDKLRVDVLFEQGNEDSDNRIRIVRVDDGNSEAAEDCSEESWNALDDDVDDIDDIDLEMAKSSVICQVGTDRSSVQTSSSDSDVDGAVTSDIGSFYSETSSNKTYGVGGYKVRKGDIYNCYPAFSSVWIKSRYGKNGNSKPRKAEPSSDVCRNLAVGGNLPISEDDFDGVIKDDESIDEGDFIGADSETDEFDMNAFDGVIVDNGYVIIEDSGRFRRGCQNKGIGKRGANSSSVDHRQNPEPERLHVEGTAEKREANLDKRIRKRKRKTTNIDYKECSRKSMETAMVRTHQQGVTGDIDERLMVDFNYDVTDEDEEVFADSAHLFNTRYWKWALNAAVAFGAYAVVDFAIRHRTRHLT